MPIERQKIQMNIQRQADKTMNEKNKRKTTNRQNRSLHSIIWKSLD